MPMLPTTRSLLRGWLLLALSAVACVGTPTPEPPDLLPRPNIIVAREAAAPAVVVVDDAVAPIEFQAPPGAVVANADVWIVNLDNTESTPSTVRANANGSFAATITDGRVGDRIRFVARSEERHSLPVDLQIVTIPQSSPQLADPMPDLLGCLQVSPAEDVTVVVSASPIKRRVGLDNGCGEAVTIERAALRFGDQGVELGSAPTRVPAGAQVELELTFAGHSADVRADIVLLDLSTDTTRSRRALGVWSLAR